MFGLSTWEVLIILALALIFVGPGELPKVARTIGKGMAQVRGAMGKVDDEVRRAMREAAAELDDDGKAVVPPAKPGTPETPDAVAQPADTALPLTPGQTDAQRTEPPVHLARDWSQVGKAPVAGRVATAASASMPAADASSPSNSADASATSPTSNPAAAVTSTDTPPPGTPA